MAEKNSKTFCKPCDRDGLSSVAIRFCHDCREPLCQNCSDTHRKPLPSRNHKIKELDCDIKDEVCSKHAGDKTDIYCFVHEKLICAYCCYEMHKECNTERLSDINESFLNGNEVKKCLETLRETEDNAECIESEININMDRFKTDQESCEQDLDAFNNQAQDKLQELFQDMKNVYAEVQRNTSLSSAMESCKQAKDEIKNTYKQIESCQKRGHPSRLFVELQRFPKVLENIKSKLVHAKTNNECKTYAFKKCSHFEATFLESDLRLGTFEEINDGSDLSKVKQLLYLMRKFSTS